MITPKQRARQNMRRALYAAIRCNRFQLGESLSRHEIVEVLANILSGQIEIFRDDARKQRSE